MVKAAVVICPCENCNETFKQEPKLYEHLKKIHSIDDVEKFYVDLYHGGIAPVCACDDEKCRRKLKWFGWKKGFASKFIKGHNANVEGALIRSKEVNAKAAAARIGNTPWNKDQTKATDERVAIAAKNIAKGLQRAYSEGKVVPWQLGETKETNESLRQQSNTKKERFAAGEIHSWSEGLTKETDERLAKISEKTSQRLTEKNHNRFTKEEFDEIISSQSTFDITSTFEDYKNRDDKLRFKCRTCGEEQLKDLKQLRKCPVCFKCHPKGSAWQVEVYEFVKQYCPDVESSNRKIIAPLELDIYVPSKNFGIECNGLFYHCELNDSFDKHHIDIKTQIATSAGVRLFHIFEDEWKNNKNLIEKMILHRLGFDERKIDARKCTVISMKTSERRRFFASNHIDGDSRAAEAWGLFDGKEIIACLSIKVPYGKTGKKHPESLEIARFAVLAGVNVRGALGKLMKHANSYASEKGYKHMMTYVDGRIGDGSGYKLVGFQKIARSAPRFWWTDRKFYRLPREAVRATLKTDGRSEKENAEIRGVCRIYGCKNYVFKKSVA